MAEEANPENTFWQKVCGWGPVGVVVSALYGCGISFMTSFHPYFSDGLSFVATAILLAKFWTWQDFRYDTSRKTATLLAGVTISMLTFLVGSFWLSYYLSHPSMSSSDVAQARQQLATPQGSNAVVSPSGSLTPLVAAVPTQQVQPAVPRKKYVTAPVADQIATGLMRRYEKQHHILPDSTMAPSERDWINQQIASGGYQFKINIVPLGQTKPATVVDQSTPAYGTKLINSPEKSHQLSEHCALGDGPNISDNTFSNTAGNGGGVFVGGVGANCAQIVKNQFQGVKNGMDVIIQPNANSYPTPGSVKQ